MKKIIPLIFLALVAVIVAILSTSNTHWNNGEALVAMKTSTKVDDSTKVESPQIAPTIPERTIDDIQYSPNEDNPIKDNDPLGLSEKIAGLEAEIEALRLENSVLRQEIGRLHKKSLMDHVAWKALYDPDGKLEINQLQKLAVDLFETLPEVDPHDLSPSQMNDLVIGFAKLRTCEEVAQSAFCGSTSATDEQNQEGIRDILKREKEESERFRTNLANQFGNEVAVNWNH